MKQIITGQKFYAVVGGSVEEYVAGTVNRLNVYVGDVEDKFFFPKKECFTSREAAETSLLGEDLTDELNKKRNEKAIPKVEAEADEEIVEEEENKEKNVFTPSTSENCNIVKAILVAASRMRGWRKFTKKENPEFSNVNTSAKVTIDGEEKTIFFKISIALSEDVKGTTFPCIRATDNEDCVIIPLQASWKVDEDYINLWASALVEVIDGEAKFIDFVRKSSNPFRCNELCELEEAEQIAIWEEIIPKIEEALSASSAVKEAPSVGGKPEAGTEGKFVKSDMSQMTEKERKIFSAAKGFAAGLID